MSLAFSSDPLILYQVRGLLTSHEVKTKIMNFKQKNKAVVIIIDIQRGTFNTVSCKMANCLHWTSLSGIKVCQIRNVLLTIYKSTGLYMYLKLSVPYFLFLKIALIQKILMYVRYLILAYKYMTSFSKEMI